MEQILALYALPYDPAYPVICFDERPCFLIGDTLTPIPMQPDKLRKQHYTYENSAHSSMSSPTTSALCERTTEAGEFTFYFMLLVDGAVERY